MANRRMFAKDVIETDDFLEMPVSSQLLYFHLGLQADDDGFVQPRRIMKMIGSGDDDLRVLITRLFVLPFEDGRVVVIRDWRRHNEIRYDRYKETAYQQYKSLLTLDVSNMYTLGTTTGTTTGTPRIGEDRINKVRINKVKSQTDNKLSGTPGYDQFQEMKQKLVEKKTL